MSKQSSALRRFVSSSLVVVGVVGQFAVRRSYKWRSEFDVEEHNGHPSINKSLNGSGIEVVLNTECKGELIYTASDVIDFCMSSLYKEEWSHVKTDFDAKQKTLTDVFYKDDKCEEECGSADSSDELKCSDPYKRYNDPTGCIDSQGLAHVVVNVYTDEDCKDEDVVIKNYKLAAYECRNSGYFTNMEWEWRSAIATIEDGVYEMKTFSDKDCKTLVESSSNLKFKTSGCVKINEDAFHYESTKMHVKVLSFQETDSGFKTRLAPLAAIAAAWIVL